MKLLEPGMPAPEFKLPGHDGRWYSLTDCLTSAPVAVAFFKKSCPACAITFPFLQRIHAAGPDAAPRIIGISQDSLADTLAFRDHHRIGFPLLIEESPYEVSSLYGLSFVPTVFLIETSGNVGWVEVGFSKPALRQVAELVVTDPGFRLFDEEDRLPETRPG